MITQEFFDKNLNSILAIKPQKIAVALSGGADSLALTLLLKNWAKENAVDFVALTVDHRLRKNSAREAIKVHKWMERYNINHSILTYGGKIPTSNIEAIAREYRYQMLFDYCKKNQIKYLFIAHNADEQTETFLLNLSRGSGVYGLCGMTKFQERNEINIVRPMLCFSKVEIKNYLKSIHQKWIEDPSNKDNKYKRVRIRKIKKLLDTLELSNERINNTIENMQRAKEAIDFFVDDFMNKITKNESGDICFDIKLLKGYPEEIIIRSLAKIFQTLANKNYPPRFENLKNIYDNIKNNSLGKGMTLYGFKIFVKQNNIIIEKEIGRGKKTASKK